MGALAVGGPRRSEVAVGVPGGGGPSNWGCGSWGRPGSWCHRTRSQPFQTTPVLSTSPGCWRIFLNCSPCRKSGRLCEHTCSISPWSPHWTLSGPSSWKNEKETTQKRRLRSACENQARAHWSSTFVGREIMFVAREGFQKFCFWVATIVAWCKTVWPSSGAVVVSLCQIDMFLKGGCS